MLLFLVGGVAVDALHRLPVIALGDKVDRLTQQVAGLVIHKLAGEVENKLSVGAGILHVVVGEDGVFSIVIVFVALLCCNLLGQFRKAQLDKGFGYFQWA